MKKIAIITSFAEYHLLKCLIPNIIQILNPDKIIISEGKMPIGPENKGFSDVNEFNKKWTFEGNGVMGFDWNETKSLELQYPDLVEVRSMYYHSDWSATKCYQESISWGGFEYEDLIYCFESDSFIYDGDKDQIIDESNVLRIGNGFSIKYVDFLETQYYTEMVNIENPKFRRFCYKFDNTENYQRKMGSGYLTQNYPELKRMESAFLRHYCWWRPDPYKQLRYELIHRSDPQYWLDFDIGLNEIREYSQRITHPNFMPSVEIRPSRQDEGRWAKFIDIPHPEAIKSHPNFVK